MGGQMPGHSRRKAEERAIWGHIHNSFWTKSTDLPPGRQPKRREIVALDLIHESWGGDRERTRDACAA